MDISEIVALHQAEDKTSLIYMRPSKRIGYCYINPKEPLMYSTVSLNYGYKISDYEDLYRIIGVKIGVYKQDNDVMIFVKPEDLYIHSKTKERTVKVLYGSKS